MYVQMKNSPEECDKHQTNDLHKPVHATENAINQAPDNTSSGDKSDRGKKQK